jgi:hypothetical protein
MAQKYPIEFERRMDEAFIRHSTARHKVDEIARGEDAKGMDEDRTLLPEQRLPEYP